MLEIKLHPTELYYLAFCVIHRMKVRVPAKQNSILKDEAWYEYDEVLRDIYGGDSDHESILHLLLIIETCAEWSPAKVANISRLGIVSNLNCRLPIILVKNSHS